MNFVLLIGIIILTGFLGKKLSNLVKLPGVTGYLIVGVLLGQSLLNLVKPEFLDKTGFITDITLGIVGFIIGQQLLLSKFRRIGRGILVMLVTESFGAFILVTISVLILTRRTELALLLGAIAPATAPAGTVAVIQEYRAKGRLTNSLLAIAGLDDVLCIIIFVFITTIVRFTIFSSEAISFSKTIISPFYHIIMALVLGSVAGFIVSYVLRKVRTREETTVIIFGTILLFTGISSLLNISSILVNMAIGFTAANLYPSLHRKLSTIFDETVPIIYIVFFVLAGAHFDIKLLPLMGVTGIIYIISRSAGKIGGATLGAFITKAPKKLKKYLGLGLLSQAGVAIGLSLLVVREFSQYGKEAKDIALLVVTIIAATTVIFEIVGPITAKIAIRSSGESNR
jgi:Kef-type K+ transport system membrane component KefB